MQIKIFKAFLKLELLSKNYRHNFIGCFQEQSNIMSVSLNKKTQYEWVDTNNIKKNPISTVRIRAQDIFCFDQT